MNRYLQIKNRITKSITIFIKGALIEKVRVGKVIVLDTDKQESEDSFDISFEDRVVRVSSENINKHKLSKKLIKGNWITPLFI